MTIFIIAYTIIGFVTGFLCIRSVSDSYDSDAEVGATLIIFGILWPIVVIALGCYYFFGALGRIVR